MPVLHLLIDGASHEVVAAPLIFRKLRATGRPLDDALAQELLDEVKIYNAVPPEAEASWKAAVVAAYAAYEDA